MHRFLGARLYFSSPQFYDLGLSTYVLCKMRMIAAASQQVLLRICMQHSPGKLWEGFVNVAVVITL